MPVAWSPALLFFVLMLIYKNASSAAPSLQLLNPWLSACDLADPQSAPDIQGVCLATMQSDKNVNNNNYNNNRHDNVTNTRNCRVNGDISEGPGPPSSCPCPCEMSSPNSTSTSTTTTTTTSTITTTTTTIATTPHQNANQCLDYLNESHKTTVCREGARKLLESLAKLRFRHCCEHTVLTALSAEVREMMVAKRDACEKYLTALLDLDALAQTITCKFSEVLKRYDCDQPYSVNFNCRHCKEAYRQWVCGTLFPHFLWDTGEHVRPCRRMCQKVEQQCPFFLPGDRYPNITTQYAGEPTFLCIDPNIPETGEQLEKSSYGDGGCCYHHCGKADGDICYSEQCLTTTTTTNTSTTAVTVHHCESVGVGGTGRTACSIMVHPPLGSTSTAGKSANKTLLITLLLHIIFILANGMIFGLGFT